jgi:oligoribonuclease
MLDLKLAPTTKLLWVDLEMTNLNPFVDRILEVAVIITDLDFNESARFESRIQYDRTMLEMLMAANPFWSKMAQNRDEFLNNLDSAKPSDQVEQELAALIKDQFGEEPAVIAGNSVYNDRNFIKQWWPEVEKLLHYRMLDVSSFKILMQNKYGVVYEKSEDHRALGDIKESIAELKFYLDYFVKKV